MSSFPPMLLQPSWHSCAGRLIYYLSHSKFIGNAPKNQSVTVKVAAYAARFFVTVPLLITATALDICWNVSAFCVASLYLALLAIYTKCHPKYWRRNPSYYINIFSYYLRRDKARFYIRTISIDLMAAIALPLVAIAFALKSKIMPADRYDNSLFGSAPIGQNPKVDAYLLASAIYDNNNYLFKRALAKLPREALLKEAIELFRNASHRANCGNTQFLIKLLKMGIMPEADGSRFPILVNACRSPDHLISYLALDILKQHFMETKERRFKLQFCVRASQGGVVEIETRDFSLPELVVARGRFEALPKLVEFGYEINVSQLIAFKLMVAEIMKIGEADLKEAGATTSFSNYYSHFSSKTFCQENHLIRESGEKEISCNENPYFLALGARDSDEKWLLSSFPSSETEYLRGPDYDNSYKPILASSIYRFDLERIQQANLNLSLREIHQLYIPRLTGIVHTLDIPGIQQIVIAYLIGSCPPKDPNSNINEFEIKELEESASIEED